MGYIRFLLAAAVLVSHAGGGLPAMSAEGAVEAFFVISGFYMALTFEAHYDAPGGQLRFYLSRFTRLYPLYFCGLLVMLAVQALAATYHLAINTTHSFNYFQHLQDGLQHAAVWSLLGQDLLSINPDRALSLPFRQAWSISAELVFYLSVPALLRLGNRSLWLIAALLFALKYALLRQVGFDIAYFPFFSQMGYFVLGILTFRVRHRLTFGMATTRWLGLAFAAAAVSRLDLSFESVLVPVFPLAHVAMIALLCFAMPGVMQHTRGRADELAGNISYGIYLTHLVVIDLLRAAPWHPHRTLFAATAILVAAAVSMAFEFGVQSHIDGWRKRTFYSSRAA